MPRGLTAVGTAPFLIMIFMLFRAHLQPLDIMRPTSTDVARGARRDAAREGDGEHRMGPGGRSSSRAADGLKSADNALGRAERGGRNRLCRAPDGEQQPPVPPASL